MTSVNVSSGPAPLVHSTNRTETMEPLILDTDIGSDLDDALCLAYLLAHPRCELCGITTVSGEPDRRAMIASALCTAAGRSVPIHPGTAQPLVVEQRQPRAHQAALLGRWPHEREFPGTDAVGFIRGMVRSRPGEITLLGIGPMTNIARLFREDPELPTLLKRLVVMAGWFFDRPATEVGDWNVLCDPHAADVVYRTAVAVHRSVPLDVTKDVRMTISAFGERCTAPTLNLIREIAVGENAEEIWFHDPITASTLFDDRICTLRQGRVSVDLQHLETMGMTHWESGGMSHQVAFEIDQDRFFDHYFSVLDADGRA